MAGSVALGGGRELGAVAAVLKTSLGKLRRNGWVAGSQAQSDGQRAAKRARAEGSRVGRLELLL